MNREDFLRLFPNIEGYTIGPLRVNDISGDVVGFVLIDPAGVKRYILYIAQGMGSKTTGEGNLQHAGT